MFYLIIYYRLQAIGVFLGTCFEYISPLSLPKICLFFLTAPQQQVRYVDKQSKLVISIKIAKRLIIRLGTVPILSPKLCQLTSYSALECLIRLTFKCCCSRTSSRVLLNWANILSENYSFLKNWKRVREIIPIANVFVDTFRQHRAIYAHEVSSSAISDSSGCLNKDSS
jgi:hypothetical protein